MTRKTKECPTCHRYITLNNYARHLRVCCANITKSCTHLPLEHDGLNCIFCNKLCKNKKSLTQHELRCAKNADRLKVEIKGFNDKGRRAWNKGLTKNIDLRIQKAAIKRSKTTWGRKGKPHTIQQKEVLRQHALKHQLGGFHMRRGIYYKGIKLDSSYEVIVAKNLDYNDIVWTRCSRFP